MPRIRVVMKKLKEILRLRWEEGRSVRETALSVGQSVGVVSKVENRAKTAGLDWSGVAELDGAQLEILLYGRPPGGCSPRAEPDPVWMHTELRRPGVTLELLHLEYLQEHQDGLQYTAFCGRYRAWRKGLSLSMRQVHKAGEKLFVDYSGKKPVVIDPSTGEARTAELFVAVLGASSYTYAEASWTQRVPDWLGSHIRAYEYFGGVTALVIPDQLKSAVVKHCRYEPGLQRAYAAMAEHYKTAVIPARSRKPKDKATAEVGVQVVQRWILARLRNEQFFSLEALNRRIGEVLEALNDRPMKRLGGTTRRELFERIERPALKPLPSERFAPGEWALVRLDNSYHVEHDNHLYSVPHHLVGEELEICATSETIEVLYKLNRVAVHTRSYEAGAKTTLNEHMPEHHRTWAECSHETLRADAAAVGLHTLSMLEAIFEHAPNDAQALRSGSGLCRLVHRHGPVQLESACQLAVGFGGHSFKNVERILKLGLHQKPRPIGSDDETSFVLEHQQIRGARYYH